VTPPSGAILLFISEVMPNDVVPVFLPGLGIEMLETALNGGSSPALQEALQTYMADQGAKGDDEVARLRQEEARLTQEVAALAQKVADLQVAKAKAVQKKTREDHQKFVARIADRPPLMERRDAEHS